jgi:hypothetical protein
MDERLSRIVQDYQSAIRQAVDLMTRSGIPRPATNTDWVGTDLRQTGELAGGVRYFKHGYGCAVQLASGWVDFDFGAHGEIDGFDLWRLGNYARGRLSAYRLASEEELKSLFEAAVRDGELVYSGYILYYTRRRSSDL